MLYSQFLIPGRKLTSISISSTEEPTAIRLLDTEGQSCCIWNRMFDVTERLEVGCLLTTRYEPHDWLTEDVKKYAGGLIKEVRYFRSPDLLAVSRIWLSLDTEDIFIAANAYPFRICLKHGNIEVGQAEYPTEEYLPIASAEVPKLNEEILSSVLRVYPEFTQYSVNE